ncbi:MAG: kelch repeat-containing protein [Phycisphaerales bacterium]
MKPCRQTVIRLVSIAALALPVAGLAPTDVWNVGGLSPAPRCEHSLVWDSQNQRLVLFGGLLFDQGSNIYSNETWAMVGDVWRHIPPQGANVPQPRLDHAAAYDKARRRLVVYGGVVRNDAGWSASDETWEWNGLTWQRYANSLPGPRAYHAMVFDDRRNVCVLFGGRNQPEGGTRFGDTWEWSGDSWALRAKGGPSPRTLHAMAYDSDRGVTVLHGGRSATQAVEDTWEWDGSTWRLAAQAGPKRNGHTMAYDRQRRVSVIYSGEGGLETEPLTWEWNGSSWRSLADSGGYRTHYGVAAYDAAAGRVVASGGNLITGASQNIMLRDTIGLSPTGWTQAAAGALHANPPVFDADRRQTISLASDPREAHGESLTQAWDGLSWTTLAVESPPPRRDARLVFDSLRRRVVLSGGTMAGTLTTLGDTWEWSGGHWQHVTTTQLATRSRHAMSFDVERRVTVSFGGSRLGVPYLGDTVEFDGTSWRSVATTGPISRFNATMAYDPIRRVSVLFGGRAASPTPFVDTWAWNGSAWSQLATSGPAIDLPHMTFDHARGKLVLVRREGTTTPIEAWEWNGSAWAALSVPQPVVPALANNTSVSGVAPLAGITYDAARSRLIAVHSTGVVYELGPVHEPAAILRQPAPVALPERRDATFSVEAAGSGPVRFRWRRDGVDLIDGVTPSGSIIHGSRDKSLSIMSITPADAGVYTCLVQNLSGDANSAPVTLEVLCYADCDGTSYPPIISTLDYVCFMNKFAAGDPYANCDGSTVPPTLNAADFICFLSELAAGCQ